MGTPKTKRATQTEAKTGTVVSIDEGVITLKMDDGEMEFLPELNFASFAERIPVVGDTVTLQIAIETGKIMDGFIW